MPFRSEGEQVREQIRRVEEEARELLEEQAALERQAAAAGGRSLVGLLVAVVAIVAATFIGFGTGTLAAEKRATRRMEDVVRDEAARLDAESARLYDCGRERERAATETTTCSRDGVALEWRLRQLSLPAPLDYAPLPRFR